MGIVVLESDLEIDGLPELSLLVLGALANKTSMGVPGGMHLGAAAADPNAGEAAVTATASQSTWWQDPFQAFGPAGVLHQALSAGAFNADQAMSTMPSNFSGSAATMMQLAASECGATTST